MSLSCPKLFGAPDFDRDNDAVILTRIYTFPEYTGFLIKADAREHIVSFICHFAACQDYEQVTNKISNLG